VAPTAGNDYAASTCDRVIVSPAAAFNWTCTGGTTTQDPAPDFYLYVCTRPPANNQSTPVASCGASTPGTAPDWITTTCSQPPGPNNFATTPSLPCTVGTTTTTDGTFVTTVCDKPTDTTDYVATCTGNPGTTSPYLKVTCTPETLSDIAVPSALCTPSTVGAVVTTCPKTAGGAYPAVTPVSSCTDGATTGAPNFYETTCSNPAANNKIVFTTAALCGTPGVTPGTSPLWITRDCRRPVRATNDSVRASPRPRVHNPRTSPPHLKLTCDPDETIAPVPAAPATWRLRP
jgi:hypothetical protein